MYKIIVKHSRIEVHDYNLGDSPRLENNFKIYDEISHSVYYKGIHYDEEKKILKLPRGVDVFYIESLLGEKAEVNNKPDPFDDIGEVKIKYLPRDEVQFQAICFLLGKGDYHNNQFKSQLSLYLNTGKGKTYCSVMDIAYSRLRSIIITSSLNWLEQWKNCILEYTDIKAKEIYFLSGVNSIRGLLKKDMSKYKIILASHNTIKSYGDKYGWDKVDELFKYMRIGLKFYDEAHLNFDNIINIDFNTNTYKTIYVTATPARSDDNENAKYKLYFKNVPKISLFSKEDDPHTHYMSFKYMSHPTAPQISACKNMYGFNRSAYADYIVHQKNFYNMLIILIDIIYSMEGKALIYIGTNKSIKIVVNWIKSTFPELSNDIGIYTSTVNESIKQEQLKKKIIFSTTKSAGAAMDIKGLKFTIVLAEPFKSEVVARQTLGRTRDDNTYYIEIVDISFASIVKYYYKKKNVFATFALDCKEISFRDIDLEEKAKKVLFTREQIMKRRFLIVPAIFHKEGELIKPAIFHKKGELIKPAIFR